MIINHNMQSINAHRQMGVNATNQSKSTEKLSSGLRINRAGDDAAGLAISEKMRGQIRGLDQASRNAQDSISMIQTAEGALNETHSILQRMRELSVQAGNGTNTGTDREEIQKEINQLTSEINRIGNTTEFNNQKILNGTSGEVDAAKTAKAGKTGAIDIKFADAITIDGVDLGTVTDMDALIAAIEGNAELSAKYTATKDTTDNTKLVLEQKAGFESEIAPVVTNNGAVQVNMETEGNKATAAKSKFSTQVGANENQTITLEFSDVRASALGITGTKGTTGFTNEDTVTDGTNNTSNEAALDVSTSANAGKAITSIQNAINKVSAERSKMGAIQNRLEHTINNLGTSSENLTAAESRIRDVDMAKEMMNFTKTNVLNQAAQAMLAQANQLPNQVLSLLR